MQMENSASNGSHSNGKSTGSAATATKRNINNTRSISVSSDSLDFFYSPYPFDSPLHQPLSSSNHVDRPSPDTTVPTVLPAAAAAAAAVTKKKKVLSTTQNYLSYLATTPPSSSAHLPLPLPPPPPPPPPTAAHLMMLSCWNEERRLVAAEEDEVMGSSIEGRRSKSSATLKKQGGPVVSDSDEEINKEQRVIRVKVTKVALGLRICQVTLCFLSFFVMVSDKTRGWTGDSYYRYPEYRYLVGVNIIGCIHSGVEACDMAYCLLTGGKHVISCCSSHRIRYYLDFFIDQIVAYLLMSATSAAATRNSEWILNWGKDEFTNMANASICLSFFAFFAFALTCLFSARNFIITSPRA